MPSQLVLEEKSGEVKEIREMACRVQVHRHCQFKKGSRCSTSRT